MTRAADMPLPNWPAAMDTGMAAAYVGLSEASFRALACREQVFPIDMGLSVTRWRKRDLDGLIDRLPLRGQPGAIGEDAGRDLVAEALAKVGALAKGKGPRRT